MGKWRSKMTWFDRTNCNPDPTVETSVVTGNGVFHCQRGYNTYMAPYTDIGWSWSFPAGIIPWDHTQVGLTWSNHGISRWVPTSLVPCAAAVSTRPFQRSPNRRGARFGDPAGGAKRWEAWMFITQVLGPEVIVSHMYINNLLLLLLLRRRLLLLLLMIIMIIMIIMMIMMIMIILIITHNNIYIYIYTHYIYIIYTIYIYVYIMCIYI